MRRLLLLVFLASLVPYAGAAKRVSVVQLEQALTTAQSAHKPDADIGRQIGEFELSERLTEATLNRLSASLDPGSQAALALRLLADQSVFLDPPASELPSTAAPDDAAQQRMIEASRQSLRVDNAGLEEVLKSALDTERNRRRGRDRGRGGMEL